MASQTNVYGPPLYSGKSRSQTSSMVSRFSRPISSRSVRSCPGRSQAELTPPATPHGSQEALVPQPEPEPEPQPVFHSFLRAFYPFHPGYSPSSSTVTLPMNEGEIILVHSIHTNGWADGTLLNSGARGWLPTNYCEAYDPDYIKNLLKALLNFWDLLRGRVSAELDVFRNQDYIRGLIAGVRFLLEKSDCLTRESPSVQGHDGLRRNRKALLSDLSSLVKAAKRLQDVANGQQTEANIEDLVDELILKAFKIVTRAVKFLDIWLLDAADRQQAALEEHMGANVPPTPPADMSSFPHRQEPQLQTLPEAPVSESETSVVEDADPVAPLPLDLQTDAATTRRNSQTHHSGSVSRCETRPTTPKASRPNSRPNSLQPKRQSLSHRVSYTGQSLAAHNPKLASEKIKSAHDAFLSAQASFIGRLQIQSRSSAELLVTTNQSVIACQDLLTVVDAVWTRDAQRTESLNEANKTMSSMIAELVQATRDSLRRPGEVDEAEDVILPDVGRSMIATATACVKAAGDCAAKAKFVLERIGDFEVEEIGLGIMDSSTAQDSNHASAEIQPLVPSHQEPEPLQTPPQPSSKPPPPPPPTISTSFPQQQEILVEESEMHPAIVETNVTIPGPKSDRSSKGSLLPPLPNLASPLLSQGDFQLPVVEDTPEADDPATSFSSEGGISSNGTNSTYSSEVKESQTGIASPNSTRATTPDTYLPKSASQTSIGLAESFTSTLVAQTDDCDDAEAQILEKTYAHELVHNKDGQITGGTLPALVERLTTHDSTPDSMFVSTFYLTFRLFATPTTFATALVDRFEYVGESPHIATPVRLRVYNVFKGWIESHWRSDTDREALDLIYSFAMQKLTPVLPAAGARLIELADKVSASDAPLVPRLVSSIGKTNTSISQYVSPDSPPPPAVITKSQLNALKNWKLTNHTLSVMDFDPLEIARQLTIKESRIFCSILPEELLATEWMKKTGSNALNVRAMSTLSTDLANLVADTILNLEDAKKRASTIKQWVKIANKCLQLNNYDSLMAIICSLNSSTILRLRKTWEMVSQKTKITLENLRSIMDVSKNYSLLRARLNNQVPPCLPFVGTYLTDLTFVDVGCQTTRRLPGDSDGDGISVINFAKHTQTAKIIGDLQRFQIPYRLTEVLELQEWMEAQIQRVQASDESNLQNYYRRSLVLEPRESLATRPSPVEVQQSSFQSQTSDKKFDFLSWTHSSKDKSQGSGATTPI